MLKYMDLCVQLQQHRQAKDGLHQYRNMAQQQAPGSLEVCSDVTAVGYMRSIYSTRLTMPSCRYMNAMPYMLDTGLMELLSRFIVQFVSRSMSRYSDRSVCATRRRDLCDRLPVSC